MQYLIYFEAKMFYTKWYDHENCYADGMTVIDLIRHKYTTDGKEWKDIDFDHL